MPKAKSPEDFLPLRPVEFEVLLLHTFRTGDASVLSGWASSLTLPSDRTTFFNFLASHDGVGLNPARGILSSADIDSLIEQTLAHGGLISYKQNADGTKTPYEMNINYFDALTNPSSDESLDLQVDRFMAAQAIMLTLVGMPGIYFHSLFGSRNWKDGVNITKHNRTINRQKLQRDELEKQLADVSSLRSKVFLRYREMLLARSSTSAFDPHGGQEILDVGKEVFAVLRSSPDESKQALCLQNITSHAVEIENPIKKTVRDLLTNRSMDSKILLKPYQSIWLEESSL